MDRAQDDKRFTSENIWCGQLTVQSCSVSEERSVLSSQLAIMDVVESLRPSNRQHGASRLSATQISDFQVGRRFKSFLEFERAFNAWKSKYFHPLRVVGSETLRSVDAGIDPVCRYRYIIYQCVHYGEPRFGGHTVSAEAYKKFAEKCRKHRRQNFANATWSFSPPLPSTIFANSQTLQSISNRNVGPFSDQDNRLVTAEIAIDKSVSVVNDKQTNKEKVELSIIPRTDEERFQMIHVVLQNLCDHLLETEDARFDEKLALLDTIYSQWQSANVFEMVFFTCNGCGESVKKVQVVRHRMRCRRSYVVSCMDCGRDFQGEEYNTHKKCISEEAKYSGGTIENKETKGELKQQSWIENVQCAIDSVKSSNFKLRQLLETLKSYNNIPRKQVKFENFIKNSLRVRDVKLIKDAWKAISDTQLSSVDNGQNCANITESNGSKFDEQSKNINKKNEIIADSSNHKRKSEDHHLDIEIDDNDGANKVQKLNNSELEEWDTIVGKPKCKSVIKKILMGQLNKEMKLKKLYKAALLALSDRYLGKYTQEQLIRFIAKAITKSSKFMIDGKIVKFVE
ncbi:Cell growth-regulating nucleolar protein [Trichinella murrelli]|uniref:Cell growth-regulating nucleolar protein n=1 Tax=Trichinella murrelli TaxID=144512 RepID=A0A0V0UD21_9BILA|nr:Cell growth-regulating nucleolar protein [Trichinella murrelli]